MMSILIYMGKETDMDNLPDSILISVKPQFSSLIMRGEKTVELRKKIPANLSGKRVFVYSTCPDSKVIGFFDVQHVEALPIDELWNKVHPVAGIAEDDFYEYYTDKEEGFAIFFTEFIEFKTPLTLESIRKTYPNFIPPQNYYYVSSEAFLSLV